MQVSIMLTTHSTELDTIRSHYDSLADFVPAHLSLVFPQPLPQLQTSMLTDIQEIIQTLPETTFFTTHLLPDYDYHNLLLVLDDPENSLKKLHQALYSLSYFEPCQRRDIPFTPHITIARNQTKSQLDQLAHELMSKTIGLSVTFDTLVFEQIADNDQSIPLLKYHLT